MDLREKKTRRSIAEAFLTLRARKPLERITVRELTGLAQVSKSTFYLHYRDVYHLSEELEWQLIREVLDDIPHPENLVQDPAAFTVGLLEAFRLHQKQVDVIFSGTRATVLPDHIEQAIREYLFTLCPAARQNDRLNVLLTYQIQGGYAAYLKNHDRFGLQRVASVLAEAVGQLTCLQAWPPASGNGTGAQASETN